MSAWSIIFIVLGVLLVVGALAVAAVSGWRAYDRRLLLRLLARAEAVEAAAQALDDALGRLAGADDDDLELFAEDPDSAERRVLHEVARRAEILRDEFDVMRVPKSRVSLVDALADAAHITAYEAGCVADADVGARALDKLASVDLEKVRAYTAQARSKLITACTACGLEDTAVYGGGLYL